MSENKGNGKYPKCSFIQFFISLYVEDIENIGCPKTLNNRTRVVVIIIGILLKDNQKLL